MEIYSRPNIKMLMWQAFILLIMAAFQLSIGQVERNTTVLQEEFYAQSMMSTKTWMDYKKMTDFSKFYLCIDVIQKVEKMKIMYGQYRMQGQNMTFPEFRIESIPIKINVKPETLFFHTLTMNCPLHLIKFEKISYQTGSNFYVAESAQKNCVYMFTSSTTSPWQNHNLDIKARVCDIFLDIKYDVAELEYEFWTYNNEDGDKENGWPLVSNMNNEQRFLLCLDVFGKLIRHHMYNTEYDNNNNNNDSSNHLPEFKYVKKSLNLVTREKPPAVEFIWTLACPMNEFTFKKVGSKFANVKPYYLANSIHEGCVYKLGHYNEHQTNVNIQVEICGILIPARNNSSTLELEFMEKWSDLLSKNPITHRKIPCSMPVMNKRHQTNFAENIFGKITQKYQKGGVLKHEFCTSRLQGARLYFNYVKERPVDVMALYAAYKPELITHLKSRIYITDSVNFGCVYVLSGLTLSISFEVCDVYPIEYMTADRKKKLFIPIV